MLLFSIQLVIALVFLKLLHQFISNQKILDLFVLFLAIITVTIGEAYNLMVYKVAVYNDVIGIPWYIVLGGAVLSWTIYKTSISLSGKFNIECIFCRLFIVFVISLFLPLIEIIGLKTGLWYWTREYAILSLSWYLGVWKFYFMFVITPVFVGVIANLFVNSSNCSCKLNNLRT